MQEIDATGIEVLPMSHTVNGYGDISHSSVRSGTMLDPASEGENVVARFVVMIAASPGFTTRRSGSDSPPGSMR